MQSVSIRVQPGARNATNTFVSIFSKTYAATQKISENSCQFVADILLTNFSTRALAPKLPLQQIHRQMNHRRSAVRARPRRLARLQVPQQRGLLTGR